MMYDPDTPRGSGWWHWVVFDILAITNEFVSIAGYGSRKLVPENVIQSTTGYGSKGYRGPCPPKDHGLHECIISGHALTTETFGLDENTNPSFIRHYRCNNTLAKTSIIVYYQR